MVDDLLLREHLDVKVFLVRPMQGQDVIEGHEHKCDNEMADDCILYEEQRLDR